MPLRKESAGDPEIVLADNLAWLSGLPSGGADLIYLDPPSYSGRRRGQSGNGHSFDDTWPGGLDAYLAFLRQRLEQCRRILRRSGSLYLHLDWRAVHYARVLLDEVFGRRNFLNEIIWSYRTGGTSRRWFPRKHDNLLLYARQAGAHTLQVPREGAYRTDGLNFDAGGRPYKSTRAGRLYFDPRGPQVTDVWEIPFLSTVSKERTGWPTQKPEALLRRIIEASSNPGDLVIDPFCGSGTTLAAAQALGRRWLGCDNNEAAVVLARARLSDACLFTR